MRTGSEPAGPGMVLSLLVTPGTSAVGSVGLPFCLSTAITASAGVGCLRASAGSSVSIGLGFIAARASSTDCMSASALYLVPVLLVVSSLARAAIENSDAAVTAAAMARVEG